jgi:hypothetical protein
VPFLDLLNRVYVLLGELNAFHAAFRILGVASGYAFAHALAAAAAAACASREANCVLPMKARALAASPELSLAASPLPI